MNGSILIFSIAGAVRSTNCLEVVMRLPAAGRLQQGFRFFAKFIRTTERSPYGWTCSELVYR